MKTYNKMVFAPLILMLLLVLMIVTAMEITAAQHRVELGTAESFAILAGSGITVAGAVDSTEIFGDIGSYPTGSYTGQVNVVQTGGDVYLDGDGGVAAGAQDDLLIAYNDAKGRESTRDITDLDLGDLSTEADPLLPGVYTADTSLGLTGTLYLYADNQNDAFIFQIGSTLTTASASNIVLLGDATFCQVFWQVGSSATLGTNSTFVGHILALTDITATTDATVEGQLLALNGAVTLDNNTIINEVCLSSLATGSLEVTKNVSGDTGDMTLPPFEITVAGDGFTATRTFDEGETFTWDNLAPGTYTVIEDNAGLSSEWIVTGEGSVQVVADQTAVTTITNSYITEGGSLGSLTVGKVVSGDTAGLTLPLFKITVAGPDGFLATRTFVSGETFTWTNLVPGTYSVTEEKTGLSREWTVTGEGSVQVVADQTAVATITNTYVREEDVTEAVSLGSLTVGKIVSGDTGDMTLPLFEITVTGPDGFLATRTFVDGETFAWKNLVPGTYTVTEEKTGLSSEWTVTGEGSVQVVADETAATTITNSYLAEVVSVGSLTVGKVVTGDTGDMTLPLFEITVTGPDGFLATRTFVDGETFAWTNLVPGTYTVTEEKTELSGEWTVTGEGSMQVVADQTAVTTVINAYITEAKRQLPRTGGNDLLLAISVISIALAGGLYFKSYRGEKEN